MTGGYSNMTKEKIKDLIAKMTLEEKAAMCSGADFWHTESCERLGIPASMVSDGPHGLRKQDDKADHLGVNESIKAVCFPAGCGTAASFNRDLLYHMGETLGNECQAEGVSVILGPAVNIKRSPLCGRNFEYYSEDPLVASEIAGSLIRGVQSKHVGTSLKHFLANNQETRRMSVDEIIDERTLNEIYLAAFEGAVKKAKPWTVMCSYNKINGTYTAAHHKYLTETLRDKWGFDGFVMSDFGSGVRDTVEAANGGQNIEMSGTTYFGDKLIRAVREGQVSESTIDDAVLRIIRTMISFRDAGNGKYPDSVIGCKEHISLALQSAREGITLIQNRDSLLPLDRKQTKKLVVIGKLATAENLGDHGSSQVFPPYIVTLLEGITRAASESEVIFYEGENLSHAKELAASADAVIVVAGYNYNDEGEYTTQNFDETYTGARGGDRYDLGLHKSEIRLIQETSTANPDTIVVMIGGSTILTSEWQDSVKAILMAYYPGMEGGTALGEILFGDVSPSGKLPFVIPVSQEDLPQIEWETDYQFYEYYHGYEKLEKEGKKPAFHYGFGLSYTDFKIRDASFRLKDHNIAASCLIKNTGSRKGTEVLQLYIGFQNSSVDRPLKSLKGFQRITLDPGEEKEVEILCPLEELKWYRPETHRFELEEMEYNVYIGSSSDDNDLIKGTVNVKEEDQ